MGPTAADRDVSRAASFRYDGLRGPSCAPVRSARPAEVPVPVETAPTPDESRGGLSGASAAPTVPQHGPNATQPHRPGLGPTPARPSVGAPRCRPFPAMRWWAFWAGAAWASSTRPGRLALDRIVALKMVLAGRPRGGPGSGALPRPRRRRWPACSTRTSCRCTRSASTRGSRTSRWSSSPAAVLARELAGTPQPPREAAGLAEVLARAVAPRPHAGRRSPRPEARERAVGEW